MRIDIQVWVNNDDHSFSRHITGQFGFACKIQQGSDLGKRMNHAFSVNLKNSPYCVLIGCDCPQLNKQILVQAFGHLESGKVVIT